MYKLFYLDTGFHNGAESPHKLSEISSSNYALHAPVPLEGPYPTREGVSRTSSQSKCN